MYGIGTDIVISSRLIHWVNDPDTLDYIFTEDEKSAALRKKHAHRHLAAIFAVKEAFMKAVGTGWGKGLNWRDIEVLTEKGKASLRLSNTAVKLCSGKKIFVSTSCERNLTMAMVVISDD
jgi:holo-[acyl-carrier protein] synthase